MSQIFPSRMRVLFFNHHRHPEVIEVCDSLARKPVTESPGEEAGSGGAGGNEHTQAFAIGSQAPTSFLLPPSKSPLCPSATGGGL